MRPVVFHRQLAALAALTQREQALAFRELLGKICEQLRCYFAVSPLRLKNPGEGDELAVTVSGLFVCLAVRDGYRSSVLPFISLSSSLWLAAATRERDRGPRLPSPSSSMISSE